jgi:hypothetical protein
MSKLTRFNFFVVTILSLCFSICFSLLISATPGIASRPSSPQPKGIFTTPRPLPTVTPGMPPYQQQPYQPPFQQQPIQKTPGTAGCTMTRSDGSTVNLDRICGSNILLESKDPGAIRASDLEWGPGGPQ